MIRTLPALTLTAAVGLAVLGGAVSAKPALKDVTHIREGIITVGMAYELSEKCGSVSARLLRGINYLYSLKSHARNLGYTNAEVDAYINDKQEENRLVAIARARLAERGVVDGQEATYCAVAQREIASGTPVGYLLR